MFAGFLAIFADIRYF